MPGCASDAGSARRFRSEAVWADVRRNVADAWQPDLDGAHAHANRSFREVTIALPQKLSDADQIGELVDAARLEAGQQLDLMLMQTDLVALIRRAAEQIQATSSRHTLTVDSSVPQLVGNWDGPRLERVTGNLLSNAVQYSPQVGDVAVRVALKGETDRPWVAVEVQDDGLGIPAADIPRIFDRYHRGRNVTGRIRGTGIGLAGARQIVEQHGGRNELDSVEGQGTTFTALLPLGDAA